MSLHAWLAIRLCHLWYCPARSPQRCVLSASCTLPAHYCAQNKEAGVHRLWDSWQRALHQTKACVCRKRELVPEVSDSKESPHPPYFCLQSNGSTSCSPGRDKLQEGRPQGTAGAEKKAPGTEINRYISVYKTCCFICTVPQPGAGSPQGVHTYINKAQTAANSIYSPRGG